MDRLTLNEPAINRTKNNSIKDSDFLFSTGGDCNV